MRESLQRSGVCRATRDAHPGLWWTRIAPIPAVADDGLSPDDKDALIDSVCGIPVPEVYTGAFATWRTAIAARAYTWEIELTSRLLVGHGEPSAVGIGITLHPTYGVPYIPGSSIKGVLSNYLGLSNDDWRGVGYQVRNEAPQTLGDGAPVRAPAPWSKVVFGAPPTPRAADEPPNDAQGLVDFEDAWLVPTAGTVLERDVLTPHQKQYYDDHARAGDPSWKRLPIDWDDPNPVGFVTVRPGLKFLFAVGAARGAEAWARVAFLHLVDALAQHGIGGKTSAGYGRFRKTAPTPTPPHGAAPVASSVALQAFEAAVERVKSIAEGKVPAFQTEDFPALAAAIPAAERARAWIVFGQLANHPKLARRETAAIASVRAQLGG